MPESVRFLASKTGGPASVILLGAPLDLTETFRAGTRSAPSVIREVSDSIESYSPVLDADLESASLVDWGDIPLSGKDMTGHLSAIGASALRAASRAPFIFLGGEHTITLGAINGVLSLFPDMMILQVDAHLDLMDSFDGLTVSHATVFRRIAEITGRDRIVQIGVRSGTREEFTVARGLLYSSPELQLPAPVRKRLSEHPVYLSVDIDVLDPAHAPGTGNPEPGGCSFRELAGFLYGLRGLNIVGMDVVEVSPPLDANDITSIAAAKLVRELALLFGKPLG